MSAKGKKHLDALQKRLAKLRLQLAGATRQADDPGEAEQIRVEIRAVEADIKEIKAD